MNTLSVKNLQEIVGQIRFDKRETQLLHTEITRVLGSLTQLSEQKMNIDYVAKQANIRLDLLEHKGRVPSPFKSSVMVRFLEHSNSEVRKLAARVVPVHFLSKLLRDKDSDVRRAVATRVPTSLVKEMIQNFPQDYELQVLYEAKAADKTKSGRQPTPQSAKSSLAGKRLGDAAKTWEGPELSKFFYTQQANIFLEDYGNSLEFGWKESIVNRFISSVKSVSDVVLDRDLLLKAINDLIETEEDASVNEVIAPKLHVPQKRLLENKNSINSPAPAKILIEGKYDGLQFISKFNSLYDIKFKNDKIPITATLAKTINHLDESVFDKYCEIWNRKQELSSNNPMFMQWQQSNDRKISFIVKRK